MRLVKRFFADTSGATAIEYGLIAAMIAIVIVSALKLVGTRLSAKFTTIAGNLS